MFTVYISTFVIGGHFKYVAVEFSLFHTMKNLPRYTPTIATIKARSGNSANLIASIMSFNLTYRGLCRAQISCNFLIIFFSAERVLLNYHSHTKLCHHGAQVGVNSNKDIKRLRSTSHVILIDFTPALTRDAALTKTIVVNFAQCDAESSGTDLFECI